MSLFNRKTFLDGGIEGFSVNAISLNDVGNIATFGLVPDITGEKAAQAAMEAGISANNAAGARLDRQYDQTRSDLMPFLEAATGTTTMGANPEYAALQDQIAQLQATGPSGGLNGVAQYASQLASLQGKLGSMDKEIETGRTGGALQDYQSGLNQQPGAPTLDKFNFDVTQAMNSPELAWQQEMGQQQMDRVAGKNQQLGSGNRLYDVTRFGQGLASQSLGDQYNRQYNTFGANQNTDIKNYGMVNDQYNQRMNRLAGLIDVGRGSGSAMGSMGAQNANSIAGLLQNTGQLQGANAMAGYNGINNLLGMGASALGTMYGAGGAGGAAGTAGAGNFSPIGAQDARGFF